MCLSSVEAQQENGKFSRILVTIDGTANPMKAAKFAIMMAEKVRNEETIV